MKDDGKTYPRTEGRQHPSKILLVDDDTSDLEYYCKVLQNQGHQVTTCASYATAMRLLGSEAFDFVVVNQGGPQFKARSVAKRAMEEDRHTPVLVLANSVDMRVYIEAMQLGAVDYLQKPVNPSEMTRLIRTHLKPARSRQPIYAAERA
jgi:two-component system, NtrC family, phosphoglycerate transport system response regulator PgtA